jgi:putative ABC transport system ATP-binding protein
VLASCRGVAVIHGQGDAAVHALDGVDLTIEERDSVALLGRSGSGKTTLLHVLGGLVKPSAGTVGWNGRPLGVAYVFQGANLLPYFTAFENVAFAARVSGNDLDPALAPLALLELVGLGEKVDHLPSDLSGGEAQRVAIARAIAQQPQLLLCDEPTGHLDSDTGERVLDLLEALQNEYGFGLVIATHDADVAGRLQRAVELHDGRVLSTEVAA